MARAERLALWLVAAIALTVLLTKGHAPPRRDGGVAFLHGTSGGVILRLDGDVPRPGVYRFPDGVRVRDVINMTLPHAALNTIDPGVSDVRLAGGKILVIRRTMPQHLDISIKNMRVRERMVFGVHLEPNELNENEWEALPGIGPALARAIVLDRQENGEFGSLRELSRVPGVGEGKISALEKYFANQDNHPKYQVK